LARRSLYTLQLFGFNCRNVAKYRFKFLQLHHKAEKIILLLLQGKEVLSDYDAPFYQALDRNCPVALGLRGKNRQKNVDILLGGVKFKTYKSIIAKLFLAQS